MHGLFLALLLFMEDMQICFETMYRRIGSKEVVCILEICSSCKNKHCKNKKKTQADSPQKNPKLRKLLYVAHSRFC